MLLVLLGQLEGFVWEVLPLAFHVRVLGAEHITSDDEVGDAAVQARCQVL